MTDGPQYCLGKKPARPDAVKLKFSTYAANLPKPPTDFGHDNLVSNWPMLKNGGPGACGDCVIAGGLHETQLFNAESNRFVYVNDASAIRNYSDITGYDPSDPSTDQGTDMEEAAKYRRKIGLVDGEGRRHKILAYMALDPGKLTQFYTAMWIFGAVGIGINFPAYAMDQFNAGKPWVVQRKNAKILGGHYICGVGMHNGNIRVVSWGREFPMTPGFYQRYCDEVFVYLTEERLTNGRSLDGFDLIALRNDLAQITSAH